MSFLNTLSVSSAEKNIELSHEHTESVWLTYEETNNKLKWDSNRTALYELNCRLMEANVTLW